MPSLTPKQIALIRQFMRLNQHDTANASRYQSIVKLVARHYQGSGNEKTDMAQFRQILMLLKELKEREMTGEDLRRDLVGGVRKKLEHSEGSEAAKSAVEEQPEAPKAQKRAQHRSAEEDLRDILRKLQTEEEEDETADSDAPKRDLF